MVSCFTDYWLVRGYAINPSHGTPTLGIMDMWANYTCIIFAKEDSKESRNVQNKEDNAISEYWLFTK